MALLTFFKVLLQMAFSPTATDTVVAAKIICINPAFVDPAVGFGTFNATFYENLATGAVVDSAVGTNGVIATNGGAADYSFADFKAAVEASGNWLVILVAARPEDLLYTHSGTLQHCLALTANAAAGRAVNTADGAQLLFDTSVCRHHTLVFGPEGLTGPANIRYRLSEATPLDRSVDTVDESAGRHVSAGDKAAYLSSVRATSTFTNGTAVSQWKIYASTQKASRLIGTFAGAATATESQIDKDDFGDLFLTTEAGERLLARYESGAGDAPSAMSIAGSGGYGEPNTGC
jgi:hypothetical protein